jgi:hypothetical protein
MNFYLKKETYKGKPAYRVYERRTGDSGDRLMDENEMGAGDSEDQMVDENEIRTGDSGDRLVDKNYYRFILTTSTQAKAIFALDNEGGQDYYRFRKADGKMKQIFVSTSESILYKEMAKTPREFGKPPSKGFGSRGLKKPVRLWHVKGSIQAAKAVEAHRQKVESGHATMMDLETQIVDQEALTMAQSALTRGQSYVFLPQQEAEPILDNLLLAIPSQIYGKTCTKGGVNKMVKRGINPLVQKNDNAFSFTGTQLAMSSCNAFTHAVESGKEDGKNPRNSWEWLHVRGKQMGGDFLQDNLVAGTYHGNSSMIEFENALTNHARYFSAYAQPSWTFEVTWSASCEPANSHVGKWILVEWQVNYAGSDNGEFLAAATYKLFIKAGRMAFDPCRSAIWTANEGATLLRICRNGG